MPGRLKCRGSSRKGCDLFSLTGRQWRALGILAAHKGDCLTKADLPAGIGTVTLDWLVLFALVEIRGANDTPCWRITEKGMQTLQLGVVPSPKRKPGRPRR